jgi:methylenetetrahydrofolate reductase (NADPH)
MFEKAIARIEAFAKGMVFDCHTCGQCVLNQTGLICPMSCPKGLRNGPCGGTLHGECEVYPDRPCVWIRIHQRTSRDEVSLRGLLPSTDARLHNTSSYLNMLRGTDKPTREPLAYLSLPSPRTGQPLQTASKLEARLKAGRFARTCEIRAPRQPVFDRFDHEAQLLREAFDAFNVTAYLNGKPSVPSPVAAGRLAHIAKKIGIYDTNFD